MTDFLWNLMWLWMISLLLAFLRWMLFGGKDDNKDQQEGEKS